MHKFAVVVIFMVVVPTISGAFPFNPQEDPLLIIIQSIDTDEIYRFDKTIQDFGPHPTESDACQAVAAFIYDEFTSYGLDVAYESWEASGLSSRNVVALLPGETNYTIIISAHYDSAEMSPGADDDGSGVSAVLMAAQALSQHSFQHTIKFITYSGEEQGLYGSAHHARQSYMTDERILAVLQLDGVGHAVSREGGSTIRFCANDASTWITDVGQEMLEIYGDEIGLTIHRNRNFAGSDHQSFINYGYEGVFFLEYEFNPHYHSADDTIEHVNFSYLTKVSKLAVATLATIADRDVPLYVWLVEPQRGALYFNDRILMDLGGYRTIIMGQTNAQVALFYHENVTRVEFYLDGELRGIAEKPPFMHSYSKIALFNHVVKAVAYSEHHQDINELSVSMFNLKPGNWLDE